MLSTKLSYLERVNTKRLRSTVDSHHYVLSDAQSNVLSHSNVFNGFRIFTHRQLVQYIPKTEEGRTFLLSICTVTRLFREHEA